MAFRAFRKLEAVESPAANTVSERLIYPVKEARQLWMGQSTFKQQIRLIKIGRRSYVSIDEIKRVARGSGDR